MKIKAIFYDFDGVIKESTQIKTEAFYSLYEKFGKEIAEKAKEHHIAHGGISRYEKFKFYHKTYLGIDLNASEVEDLAQEFSKIVLEKVIASNYVSGAKETLEKLHDTYQQYVVTGTPQGEIEYIIDALEIRNNFVSLHGSPDNKIVLSQRILDETGFKPSEIVFVGDATTDYNAASHFDFHFILREHEENQTFFKDHDLVKTKDLTNLDDLIEKF